MRRRILRKSRRGAAAVEMVMVAPVLVTMVFGCIDFGRFAYNYIALNNAARAGAAYGVMNSYLPSQSSTWQTSIQSAASTEMSLQNGFVSANLTVNSASYVDGVGLRRVSVNVQYPFQTLFQ